MADVKAQAVQRADLVAALDGLFVTVDGVDHVLSAHPCRPSAPQAYECWPQWMATRPTGMCVDEVDWLVLVVVPGPDAQTFVAAGDDLIDTVADALIPWQITRIEPVKILLGENQDVPGLQFALTI